MKKISLIAIFLTIAALTCSSPKAVTNVSGSTVTYGLPIEWNQEVKEQLEFIVHKNRQGFRQHLQWSGKYVKHMRQIIKEKGLPEDLVYLPLIESGFSPKAYSPSHASGLWQFVPSTAKKFGLKFNQWYDERRDFIKSTRAACDYLGYLYNIFRDWKLALAAYNAGEGAIIQAIKSQKTTDFWKLDLRQQTKEFVPRFLAAVIIAKEPEKYGFVVDYDPPLQYEIVEITQPANLKELAEQIGLNTSKLRELNPELLRDVTPPNLSSYQLRIPPGATQLFWSYYGKPRPEPGGLATDEGQPSDRYFTSKSEKQISSYLKKGKKFLHQGKYNKARQEFSKVVTLDPDNFRAHFYLGLTYLYWKKYKEAVQPFRMAIKLNPNDLDWVCLVRIYLGFSFENLREYNRAEREFYLAVTSDPSNDEAKHCWERVKYKKHLKDDDGEDDNEDEDEEDDD